MKMAGLYGIADAELSGDDPVGLAADLLAGGCRLLQLRCKTWSEDEVLRAAREVARLARPLGARLVLNDHPQLVGPAGAQGVHLGQLDLETPAARRLLPPGCFLGRSTHDPAQLEAAAQDADYVAFGPIFATAHAGRDKGERGLSALQAAVRQLAGRRPLVAIGGLRPEHRSLLRAAGVDAWAVIGAIALAPDRVAATRAWLS